MAEQNPGLLERMVRLQRAREAHEGERSHWTATDYPSAATQYIAALEQEVRSVGLLMPSNCICEPADVARDDCPVHGMLPVTGE